MIARGQVGGGEEGQRHQIDEEQLLRQGDKPRGRNAIERPDHHDPPQRQQVDPGHAHRPQRPGQEVTTDGVGGQGVKPLPMTHDGWVQRTVEMAGTGLLSAEVEGWVNLMTEEQKNPEETHDDGSPDLNNDGVVDAADLAALLGNWGECQDCAACTGDLDGDGTVGPADLAILLGSWGPCPQDGDCPADVDGDGVVAAADLAILLGNWG